MQYTDLVSSFVNLKAIATTTDAKLTSSIANQINTDNLFALQSDLMSGFGNLISTIDTLSSRSTIYALDTNVASSLPTINAELASSITNQLIFTNLFV